MMSSYIVHWSRRCKPGLLDRLIFIRIPIPVRRHHDTEAALWLHSISLFLAPTGYAVYFQYSPYTANIHRRQSVGGGNRASLRFPLSDTQFPYIAWTIGCTEEKSCSSRAWHHTRWTQSLFKVHQLQFPKKTYINPALGKLTLHNDTKRLASNTKWGRFNE